MRIALGLVSAAALLVAGSAAQAERVGPYVSVFGGYVIQSESNLSNFPGGFSKLETEDGFAVGGAFGYDFGGPRLELEVSNRHNKGDTLSPGAANAAGSLKSLALMINALYDFQNASRFTPYVGAGIGGAWVYANDLGNGAPSNGKIDAGDPVFAYQGIAGVKVAVTEGLSVFVDYRYFATLDPSYGRNIELEYETHNIMAGLTYTFGPAEVEAAAPAPVAPPAAEVARSYIVFFDWNSTAITPEAQAIIQDAANASASLGVARIELTGHADRSGSPRYNQRLSVRRAESVKSVLVGLGVNPDGIVTIGKGESSPLVPTPDGVREPQNRRVEIVLQ